MSKKNGGPQKQYEEGYFDKDHPGRLVVREVKGGDYNWGTGDKQVIEKGSQQQQKVHTSGFQTESNPNASESSTSSTTSSSTSGGGSSKKSGGAVSYKDAYAAAGGADKLGDYGTWEKKAKDWNTKKYGTTEPTAKARNLGISKTELSEAAKPVKMERKEAVPIATSTPNNNRMQQTIASANNPESLMGGTKTRREIRQANRQTNKDNREANRIRHAGQKAGTQKVKKQERQDARQKRSDKRFERKTGINMSGTPSYSPQLDTGAGTYQGGPSKPKTKKKKSSGEGWGKSGVIETF